MEGSEMNYQATTDSPINGAYQGKMSINDALVCVVFGEFIGRYGDSDVAKEQVKKELEKMNVSWDENLEEEWRQLVARRELKIKMQTIVANDKMVTVLETTKQTRVKVSDTGMLQLNNTDSLWNKLRNLTKVNTHREKDSHYSDENPSWFRNLCETVFTTANTPIDFNRRNSDKNGGGDGAAEATTICGSEAA